MGRNENIAIFKDTKDFCGSNDRESHLSVFPFFQAPLNRQANDKAISFMLPLGCYLGVFGSLA